MRDPATRSRGYSRSRYFAAPDIAYVRFLLQLHDAAECNDPDCPADRFGKFLAQLEKELETAGDRARAQVWASLFILPVAPVQLETRVPRDDHHRDPSR